jgi:hypothetical protein
MCGLHRANQWARVPVGHGRLHSPNRSYGQRRLQPAATWLKTPISSFRFEGHRRVGWPLRLVCSQRLCPFSRPDIFHKRD